MLISFKLNDRTLYESIIFCKLENPSSVFVSIWHTFYNGEDMTVLQWRDTEIFTISLLATAQQQLIYFKVSNVTYSANMNLLVCLTCSICWKNISRYFVRIETINRTECSQTTWVPALLCISRRIRGPALNPVVHHNCLSELDKVPLP